MQAVPLYQADPIPRSGFEAQQQLAVPQIDSGKCAIRKPSNLLSLVSYALQPGAWALRPGTTSSYKSVLNLQVSSEPETFS
jgi:hypothetical protein